MITEDAVKAKLLELGPLKDIDPVLEAALPALRSQAEAGDWITIKAARQDDGRANPAMAAKLNTRLDGAFGDGAGKDVDEEALQAIALEALARAVAAARSDEDAVELGGDRYELKLHAPKRGGRGTVRLRNPDAAPAEEPEAEAEEA